MSTTFADLGVPASIVKALSAQGITEPFPIQTATVADGLAGRDVCGKAPTGSGKTIAFGIPLVADLPKARPGRPTALVLAPTRELADQIASELTILSAATGVRVLTIYGGVGYGAQRNGLRKGADVVVACPGRLEDLLGEGALTLADVERVVLDEADRMADMGFIPAVRRILDATADDRQTMLFSATLDGAVNKIRRQYQTDPVMHEVEDESSEPDLHHVHVEVSREDRVATTAALIHEHGTTIVFCRTKRGADRAVRQLKKFGVKGVPIHGDRSQNQRTRALDDFTRGKAQALVATDVAARGIHVDDVACVIHFDPPGDDATYVHRSGRTGRAGATGTVISLTVDREQAKDARKLFKALGVDVTGADAPDAPPIAADFDPQGRAAAKKGNARTKKKATPAAEPKLSPSAQRRQRQQHGTTGGDSHRGEIKFFDRKRGFGFIKTGAADIFFHQSQLDDSGIRPGQQVRFEMGQGPKGDEAKKVVSVA